MIAKNIPHDFLTEELILTNFFQLYSEHKKMKQVWRRECHVNLKKWALQSLRVQDEKIRFWKTIWKKSTNVSPSRNFLSTILYNLSVNFERYKVFLLMSICTCISQKDILDVADFLIFLPVASVRMHTGDYSENIWHVIAFSENKNWHTHTIWLHGNPECLWKINLEES